MTLTTHGQGSDDFEATRSHRDLAAPPYLPHVIAVLEENVNQLEMCSSIFAVQGKTAEAAEWQLSPGHKTGPAHFPQGVGPLQKDYSLPPSFFALLQRPSADVVAELIPLPANHTPPTSSTTASRERNAFVGAFRKNADATTKKGGGAHGTTQSAVVDLFFDMTPSVKPEHIQKLLEEAYDEDPLATTRLIFQTRSIHEGKGYKEGFWVAAGWLLSNHPRTFLENLHILTDQTCKRERSNTRNAKKAAVQPLGLESLEEDGEIEQNLSEMPVHAARPHGTFDDLCDLLILHINGQLNDAITEIPDAVDEGVTPSHVKTAAKDDREKRKAQTGVKRDRKVFSTIASDARKKAPNGFKAKLARCGTQTAKHQLFAERLEKSLTKDAKFQALYRVVVDIFVKQLRADLVLLGKHRDFLQLPEAERNPFLGQSSPHLFTITYAAKWVPSPGKSADRQLHLASAIAMLLFPGDGAQLARERLQKKVLTPLRAVMKVPEGNMGQGEWKIDYTKVPSRAMARYSSCFIQHDPKGFEEYLTKVAAGKLGIAGATLFPHEILVDATFKDSEASPLVAKMADLQWQSLVDALQATSSTPLQNCLAIADVSSSMGSYLHGDNKHPSPITICIALTLLLGQLAAPPWNGLFFTFSSEPSAVYIDPSLPLGERAAALQQAQWGKSTNFYKVFDLILNTAQTQTLKPEKMVKKLFIFSDMQFDQCVERKEGDTEYSAIKRKFSEAGYTLPELVFWNLASRAEGTPKPVRADQVGVSLFSGYSGSMMKYFLGEAAREEDEEDEKLAEAMADDWGAINEVNEDEDEEMEVVGTAEAAQRRKASREARRKKDDPLDAVHRILAAESFKAVVVVD